MFCNRTAVLTLALVMAGAATPSFAETTLRPTTAAGETPQPKYASPAETQLRAGLMRQLKPLLDFKLSDADRAGVEKALALITGRRNGEALALRDTLSEPAAKKLITWRFLQRGGPQPAADYRAFLDANPLWPDRRRLQRFYEAALFREGGSAKAIKSAFKKEPPISGGGQAALAAAELALGNTEKARKLAAQTWCYKPIPARIENDFLARFGTLLTERDHRCRLDRLLIANPRGRGLRRSRLAAARRLLPRLGEADRQKALARIKVFARRGGLKELRAIVKSESLVKGDWGLAFQRAVRSRRLKNYAHAYRVLKAVPGEHERHVNRDQWWSERERHARHWIAKGQVSRAYKIIADVRPESVNPAKEQAFLAGWLALMRLGRPRDARDHFKRMVSKADGPLSKSKSEYWLARAYRKLGNKAKAAEHFGEAAKIRDTFHGLLARLANRPKNRTIDLPTATLPSNAELKRFLANDAVKAMLIGYSVKLRRRDMLAFYRALGRGLETEGELALLAQLADAKGDGQASVRSGKYGIARGFNLYEFAYPVHLLPDYEPLRQPAEPALLLAIGRQESEFNTRIVSRAGARGVLQVMPITARHICRQYRIKCRLKDLLNRPSYNTRIASAYIADRRDEFAGSYILTMTGFNAGPGRTRQWLRQMGDPRSRKVRPLDWIYRIPFEETRLYVRKVLSNVQIYRARLGEKKPLQLDRDLRRGRS